MLARGVLCRVAADVPKTSTHDLPQLAHLLRRTLSARNARSLPALSALSRACNAVLADARRSYATTVRATKPTRTVKKDVKKAVAKKPAPKKKVVAKKAVTKKPAPKKKAVAKKAKPKKKAVAKPRARRAKKVLTPEEKEKQTIRELKKTALVNGPAPSRYLPLSMMLKETMPGAKGQEETRQIFKETAARYKALTPAEREVSGQSLCYYHHASGASTNHARGSITTTLRTRRHQPVSKPTTTGSTATLPTRSVSPTMHALC